MRSFLVVFLLMNTLHAIEFIVQDVNSTGKSSTWIALPYAFSSDSMGLTGGVVGLMNGFIQPQMSMVVTAFMGEELPVENVYNNGSSSQDKANSQGFLLAINGYKPSFSKRMFLSFMGSYAYYPNQKIYLDGSNDTKKNIDPSDNLNKTPLQTQGYNNWANIDFRYVLPIGEEKNNIIPTIKLSRGIAVNRNNVGNGIPFVTGQTIVGTKLFYNQLTADKFTNNPSLNTNGIRLYVEHDNTDYPDNPSRGYNMKLQTSIDFGEFDSTRSWNSLEANYSYYFELPNYSWTRQNVIALNTWTAFSPTWEVSDTNTIEHRPPMWEGARLGGYDRMRAYDMNRFSDKAAIYFGVEYRVIPEFNPMRGQKWNPIPIDWFQVVLFSEAGRVAPQYNVETLMSDMKYDVGFSIRALAAKIPVRFDMAYGAEGSNMWVMVKQPF